MLNNQRPADWVLTVMNMSESDFMEEYSDMATSSTSISLPCKLIQFEQSRDEDEVMSAIAAMLYCSSHSDDDYDLIVEQINQIEQDRWVELFQMNQTIVVDCLKLFGLMANPPEGVLEAVAPWVAYNDHALRSLINVWTDADWPMTLEVAYTIQRSEYGWKFIAPYLSRYGGSNALFDNLFKDIGGAMDRWFAFCMLFNTNGSALELLLWVDVERADGLKSTIDTIDALDLWDTILANPAAGPIIDYALEHHSEVMDGQFDDRETLRIWLVQNMEGSELISNYVSIDDIKNDVVNFTFFSNPFATKFIAMHIHSFDGDILQTAIDGLAKAAITPIKEMALPALKLILDQHKRGCVEDEDWVTLLIGQHSREPTFQFLLQHKPDRICHYLNLARLLPKFTDEGIAYNITPDSVKFVQYDKALLERLSHCILFLHPEDLRTLIDTEFGVKMILQAVHSIGPLAETGLFAEIIRSPHVSIEDILRIDRVMNDSDYYDDDEFFAILRRKDAFVLDKQKHQEQRSELCLELLTVWYDPERISRMARAYNIEFRDYVLMA